jgi:glycosyltransferase involved in cell wall biosynthesis
LRILAIQPFARTPGHYDWLTQKTCEAFGRLGNDVTLVTYCGIDNEGTLSSSPPFKLLRITRSAAGSRGASCPGQRVYLSGLRAYARWQIRDFRTCCLAAWLLRQEPGGVAHFFDSDAIVLTLVINSFLRRKRPVLLLMTVHQAERPLSPAKRLPGKLNRWLYRHCLARLIRQDLDGLVVFDPSIKQLIVDRLGIGLEAARRIRVLPVGIDTYPETPCRKEEARRRLALQADETIFLLFGVLRADKRIDLAIEAMRGISHCRLMIVGGPQDFTEAEIRELARRHGCEESVSTEADYVPEHKMHDYFSACDAVLMPYAASFRSQSAVLTLACGHGKPVIASDVRTLGEAVKRYDIGFAVEPDSASALRAAIVRFLALGPEERVQMVQRVRSYAKVMSWDNTCREWLEFYRTLLEKRGLVAHD